MFQHIKVEHQNLRLNVTWKIHFELMVRKELYFRELKQRWPQLFSSEIPCEERFGAVTSKHSGFCFVAHSVQHCPSFCVYTCNTSKWLVTIVEYPVGNLGLLYIPLVEP